MQQRVRAEDCGIGSLYEPHNLYRTPCINHLSSTNRQTTNFAGMICCGCHLLWGGGVHKGLFTHYATPKLTKGMSVFRKVYRGMILWPRWTKLFFPCHASTLPDYQKYWSIKPHRPQCKGSDCYKWKMQWWCLSSPLPISALLVEVYVDLTWLSSQTFFLGGFGTSTLPTLQNCVQDMPIDKLKVKKCLTPLPAWYKIGILLPNYM